MGNIMQDHYFKYVCTDGKTVFFALHKSDLEAERNNDINLYFENVKQSRYQKIRS